MARWKVWLHCLGKAVWAKAPQALMKLLPFGEQVYDIAAEFAQQLHEHDLDGERSQALAELVVVDPVAVHQEAQVIAAAVAPGDAVAQQKLTQYLELAPIVSKQSLRRPEDPTGTTVPPQIVLSQPRTLAAFIPAAPPRFLPGDAPAGLNGWLLARRLGVGGFGEVWLAHHPDNEHLVSAVKFCLDAQAAALLGHEARVISRVMSAGSLPGIVPLRDYNLKSDPPWLKYDYVEGGDLIGHVAEFAGARATATIAEIADIVGHFHRLTPPVVHRDLKPANILVSLLPGGRRMLRVADFGIGGTASTLALRQDRVRTMPTAALPTLLQGSHTGLYASWQQKHAQDPDPRDDVFALGVLWYQLLVGDLTCERPSGKWRKRVGSLGLSESLLDLLEGCCDDDPGERPSDAADLAEKIRQAGKGPVVPKVKAPVAKPVPPPPPVVKQPSLAEVAAMKKREREQVHAEARQCKQKGDYARAVSVLERLEPERRDAGLYTSLVQRRDEVQALEKELSEAAHNDRLTWKHRPKAERWKQLQPGRAAEIDPLLQMMPDMAARLTNSLGMTFVLVQPGTFWMGGGGGQCGNQQVTISEPFYLGIHAVTQAQWQAVMGNNPSHFQSQKGGGPDHPVEQVSWDDVQQFIARLNEREKGGSGHLYRLTTEAEWEYACRGGHLLQTKQDCSFDFYFDSGPTNSLSSTQANFDGNQPHGGAAKGPYLQRTSKVGSYRPNKLGIYDMHGNVWEWCSDLAGSGRVLRGGSWSRYGGYCRAAYRGSSDPSGRSNRLGFRLALSPSGPG